MPQTTSHELRYPDGSATRNVPRDLRYLAEDVDRELEEIVALLANVSGAQAGTLAARPAATSKVNTLYVATDGLNAGRAFLSVGTSQSATWVPLAANQRLTRILADAAADVPLQVQGAVSQSGDLAQFLASGGAPLFRITALGRVVTPVNPVTELSYDATTGNLTGVVVRTVAGGGAILSSSSLTYNGDGTLASVAESADGRTVTLAFTYSGGRIASVTEVVS